MRPLSNLELHVTHSCNLYCESCSHYSNHGHKGHLPLADASRWMELWNKRLSPRVFSLLGGEPTIHPDLSRFVLLVREHWPAAHLRLVTNGFFLHRHPQLPEALRQAGNAAIHFSVHHESEEYVARLRPAVDLLNRWKREFGITVNLYASAQNWTRRYKGFGDESEPYEDGDPRSSWMHCPARHCPQIYQGKIWKCAPLAYLGLQNEKFRLSSKWTPYLEYEPLSPSCTDAELHEFFDREHESHCGMCPSRPERFPLPLPTSRKSLAIVS